ncbi:MAG TPA: hypothetical protein VGM80_00390 [Gaiellaceae bacterium]
MSTSGRLGADGRTTTGRRELLASRAEAWRFLAEPYHLSDWWPGAVSVEPDRRGFALDARWQVRVFADPPGIGFLRMPRLGRPSGPLSAQMLVITAIEPESRWEWELIRRLGLGREGAVTDKVVSVSLRALEAGRTEVTIDVRSGRGTGVRHDARLAQTAADRLYDLVQMASTL